MTALRLAWRQARGARRHFVVFFLCVVLGVAALVSVGSFAATLNVTLAREAKGLLGGDVELRSARPLSDDVRARPRGARARRPGAPCRQRP